MAQVDNAVLLDKVINCQDRDLFVCMAYDCAHATSLDRTEHFNQCIKYIKELDDVAWNTKICQEDGKRLNVSWRDYHVLCNEILPSILGETIINDADERFLKEMIKDNSDLFRPRIEELARLLK